MMNNDDKQDEEEEEESGGVSSTSDTWTLGNIILRRFLYLFRLKWIQWISEAFVYGWSSSVMKRHVCVWLAVIVSLIVGGCMVGYASVYISRGC